MDAKYYKDYRHNYLILNMPEESADRYPCRMITTNRITGLLSCQEKHINGGTLLYYDISSRQNMESLYENRTITMKTLRNFFIQLKMTWEGMSKFLLNESCLVLRPEYIFLDAETESFSFLYYPFETEENYLMVFLEFLLDKVDKGDEEVVEIVYQMYDLAEREQFMPDEVLIWFEEKYKENHNEQEKENPQSVEINDIREESVFEPEKEEKSWHQKTGTEGKKQAFTGLVLSIATGAILLYLYINYQFAEREWIYFRVAALAAGVVFLISGGFLLYEYGKRRIEELGFFNRTGASFPVYREAEDYEGYEEKEAPAFGNTVFIPWVENCENKLYGMGKGNKNHIDLGHLPLTVGKLAGSVDMVIADQSISRRHVKFVREGSHVYMTDLNSTNGTFKNGFRLEPNTSEILEPGDEIRLGKLKFIYR